MKKGTKSRKRHSKRSGSGSSSSRDSSSSAEDGEEKHMRWVRDNDKSFSTKQLTRLWSLRFKRRSDFVNFHAKLPGTLAAHMLGKMRRKAHGGNPKTMKELKKTNVVGWSQGQAVAALEDVRDQREIQALVLIFSRASAVGSSQKQSMS
jgi:hypothetical protein